MRTALEGNHFPPVVSKLLKPKRAAQIIDRSIRYIYCLEQRGEIEMVRDGRAAYVVADSLDAYVARPRVKATAARAKEPAE
jgi:hypothetical protein